MKLNNFHKASALVGAAAIAISAGWASYNNSPEAQQQRAADVQECVSGFSNNLKTIEQLYVEAKNKANTFNAIKNNLGEDTANDMLYNSQITDGSLIKATAKDAERKMLDNVGNFDIDMSNPNDKTQILNLCLDSSVRKDVKAASEILNNEDNKKHRFNNI